MNPNPELRAAIARLTQASRVSVAHPSGIFVRRDDLRAILAMITPEETGGWRESVEAAARAVLREMAPGIKDAAIAHVERNQEPVWLDALRYASAALAAAPKAPGGDDSPADPYGPETGWNGDDSPARDLGTPAGSGVEGMRLVPEEPTTARMRAVASLLGETFADACQIYSDILTIVAPPPTDPLPNTTGGER